MPCALYPHIEITDDTLGTSYKEFSMYLKVFVNVYCVACNRATCNCNVCECVDIICCSLLAQH